MDKETFASLMRQAFNLGQLYWQQADSEYSSHWKKADTTAEKFKQLVEDSTDEFYS